MIPMLLFISIFLKSLKVFFFLIVCFRNWDCSAQKNTLGRGMQSMENN